jgi:hypothetical protein
LTCENRKTKYHNKKQEYEKSKNISEKTKKFYTGTQLKSKKSV